MRYLYAIVGCNRCHDGRVEVIFEGPGLQDLRLILVNQQDADAFLMASNLAYLQGKHSAEKARTAKL